MGLVVDGTKTSLFHSGLSALFWPQAAAMFCDNWNFSQVQDKLDKTAHEECTGLIQEFVVPFGAACTYVPTRPQLNQEDKAEPRGREAVVVGYSLGPNDEWQGEFLVVEVQDWIDGNIPHQENPRHQVC